MSDPLNSPAHPHEPSANSTPLTEAPPTPSLLSQLRHRRPSELALGAEAFVLLAIFRACLAFVPVRRIVRTVTHGTASPPQPAPIDPSALPIALRVRWAVEAVSRNAPARFVCFPQSLAGYVMLRRRRVPSTIVYGVARSPEGKLIAHTWLTLGDRIVLGGAGSDAYTPVERWT